MAQSKVLVYPEGADRQLLRKFQAQALAERKRQFGAEHKAFLRQAAMKAKALSPLVNTLGVSKEEIAKLYAKKRKDMQTFLKKETPPAFRPLTSHNPVRYAPYDMTWSSASWGGITIGFLRGPNAKTGEIGADMGIFNGGGASTVCSVGFWYFAQHDSTLFLSVQASVWGRGYVFSGLFGYASAYAGLRAYVERYSSDFKVFSATTDIYDDWGVLEFDIGTFDWVTRTVGIIVPLRANTWYAIWADAVQHAYAGGIADSVSNFDMYVGPVSYAVI